MYFIGFILPIFLCFLMRASGSNIEYIHIITTYGYSFISFIPSIILSLVNIWYIQIFFLLTSSIISFSIIFSSLWEEIKEYDNKKKYFCLGLIVSLQIVILLLIRFYFIGL